MFSFRCSNQTPQKSACRPTHLLTRSEFDPQHQQATTSVTSNQNLTCHQVNCEQQPNQQQQQQQLCQIINQQRTPNYTTTTNAATTICPTTSGCIPHVPLNLNFNHHHLNLNMSQSSSSSIMNEHEQHELSNTTSNNSSAGLHGQYFMRSSLNESIKTRRSHRRRQSHRRSSGRRGPMGSGLASAGGFVPLKRTVRFQPIPQAINISAYSSGSGSGSGTNDGIDDEDEGPDCSLDTSSGFAPTHSATAKTIKATQSAAAAATTTTTTTTTFIKSRHHINIKRVQQQLTRLGRKSRIRMRPGKLSSSKPTFFTQQLGNNIKSFASFGGKIKSFATHLQQSLGSSGGGGGGGGGGGSSASPSAHSSMPRPQVTPKLAPLQKTFHLRHSAASAKHQITLRTSNLNELNESYQQQQQQPQQKVITPLLREGYNNLLFNNQQHQHPPGASSDLDDAGWGSDFDDTPSNVDMATNSTLATNANNDTTSSGTGGGCYLLEIGKPSCDTRAVGDVIQDQGICGHFKRLHDVSLLDIPYQPPTSTLTTNTNSKPKSEQEQQAAGQRQLEQLREGLQRVALNNDDDDDDDDPQVVGSLQVNSPPQSGGAGNQTPGELTATEDAGEEDDEAELRSLEARQGYKQVRDKLKLILDQRLACFERDLSSPMKAQQQQQQQSTPLKSEQQQQPPEKDQNKKVHSTTNPPAGEQQQQQQTHPLIGVEVQVDRFDDCQSNCSEASSLSSGGLDSNHSGSQDSGHSTQHSGYSAINQLRHHHHHHSQQQQQQKQQQEDNTATAAVLNSQQQQQVATSSTETSPTNQLDSGASTCGDELSPSSPQAMLISCNEDEDEDRIVAKSHHHLSSTPKTQVPMKTTTTTKTTTKVDDSKPRTTHSPAISSAKPASANDNKEQDPKQQVVGAGDDDDADDCEERRNRFIQNRLIINSKLESMFRSRSGGALPSASGNNTSTNSRNSQPPEHNNHHHQHYMQGHTSENSPTKSIQSCPTPAGSHNLASQASRFALMATCQSEPSIKQVSGYHHHHHHHLDPTTRLKLLEQQRQMSLKLKQKPRRRTAKRALNLAGGDCGTSQSSSSCNGSLDNQSIMSSQTMMLTNNEDGTEGPLDAEVPPFSSSSSSPTITSYQIRSHHHQSTTTTTTASKTPCGGSRFTRQGSTRRRWTHNTTAAASNQESLTKQLSMVCLRQLDRVNDEQDELESHNDKHNSQQVVVTASSPGHHHHHHHQTPRPALSLRQLVKEVIDDCEKPSKLSTLTRSILTRSDSLSSQDGNCGGGTGESSLCS